MKYNMKIRKYLHFLVTILVKVIILIPSISGNLNTKSYATKENNNKNFAPLLGFELALGFLNPGLNIYLLNMVNETFRGNVSCKFDIDVPIIIFGDILINVTSKYVEIKPQNRILLYGGLVLGFGYVNAYIDLPPPVDI